MNNDPRVRRIHRWVAVIFTLTVAANFAVLPWQQPPVWLTYAPLPPLLFLMITGLTILWMRGAEGRLTRRHGPKR